MHKFAPIELKYPAVRARAETLRMMLHHSNITFTDTVMPFSKIEEERPMAPMGVWPTLTLHGAEGKPVLFESGAIARFIGKHAELYPADPLAAARCDAVFEVAQHLSDLNPLLNMFDEEKRKERGETIIGTALMRLERLNKQFEASEHTFSVGNDPTMGDFHLWHVLDVLELCAPGSLAKLPGLEAFFVDLVKSSEGMRRYLAERPKPGSGELGAPNSIMMTSTSENPYYKDLI
mmetsp:Transcript_242/g.599  ORF Transcript_242/g.599 Transcript_242/m.599 type:complete len:234 (-) Transcript_242:73-774(-)